jgi:general secretion pathway protein F
MPIYEYKAIDTQGGTKSGIVDADTPREARNKLRADGIHVVDVQAIEERKSGDKAAKGRSFFIKKVNSADLAIVTRQFATLLGAGISVVDALKAMIDQVESKDFEKVLRDVREKVTQGDSLAEAMGRHPGFFNDLFVSMVKAGEASGQLDYPTVMVIVGVLVVIVLMTFVVPKLTSLFSKVGKALPGITKALIAVSDFFRGWWWAMILLGVLVAMFLKVMRRTPDGRLRFDRGLMAIPVLGDLVRKTAISRFATTSATLLRSGIPVLETLKIVETVVQNAVLAQCLSKAHTAILEGSDISTPLMQSGVFPPMVSYMIATGEQSGQLESLLENISGAYDEEIDIATQRLTSVLEPVIIIFLAGAVLFVVSAIVIPLMQMGNLTRGRG